MGSCTGNGREDYSPGVGEADKSLESNPLEKQFVAKTLEPVLYAAWEQAGLFTASAEDPRPAFSMVIPPPNVTGVLHMGHALDNTLQDILVRYKRMDGYAAVWIPGTDHAGIATQTVVEKQLAQQGRSRQDMSRSEFLAQVWQWKEKSGSSILHQLRRLGASCDWTRERFTLDPGLSHAVRKTFVELYRQGLIYRSSYLVNWSPQLRSAISDLEVEYKEVDGFLYHFLYKSVNGNSIAVATTRPETILGDTAVAVHPDDTRYSQMIGQILKHPFMPHSVTVIADERVDQNFGTGAVKVTPAHDAKDYEMGLSHGLDFLTILDEQGRIQAPGTPYHQLDRFIARKNIVADLKQLGLFIKQEPYRHAVGHCQRTGVPVEPRISQQWFVKIAPLAQPAIDVVNNGTIKFIPEHWTKTYLSWMENIRDWCISRQLWWGHQIPVWYCQDCGKESVAELDIQYCQHCNSSAIKQDPDVLDTWFSSALWPFSTLGWPEHTNDLKKFYPTTILVTGFDIIFFWVARMIMMGLWAMKDIPFQSVHIHALVRDEDGKKMSKSKGNVVDPLEIIDNYGADAFRFALASFAAQGRDIVLSLQRIEGYRNFMTKLWNASRFVLGIVQNKHFNHSELSSNKPRTLPEQWILSRLDGVTTEVRHALEETRFNDAAEALYRFVWHEYCDWFLELAKSNLSSQYSDVRISTEKTLLHTLDNILTLLHPFTPFITEAIWQKLPIKRESEAPSFLMAAAYPKQLDNIDRACEQTFFALQGIVDAIRSFRAENNLANSRIIPQLYYEVLQDNHYSKFVFDNHSAYIKTLTQVQHIEQKAITEVSDQNASQFIIAQPPVKITIPWHGLVDPALEIERVKKQLVKLEADQEFLTQRLAKPSYRQKAPAELIAKDEGKLTGIAKQIETLQSELDKLKN